MFAYFIPQASAPDVNAQNLKEETVCVGDAAKNHFLWTARNELSLVVWVNPRGPVMPKSGLECYWYPKEVAQRVLNSLDQNPDYQAYVTVLKGIQRFIAEAKTEYRRTQESYLLRKAAKRAASSQEVQHLLEQEAIQHDRLLNRGRR